MTISGARKLVIGTYASAIFLIMALNGNIRSIEWWTGSVLFLLWTVLPVAVLCLVNRRNPSFPIAAAVLGIGGIAIYIEDMFGEGVRSTSGLIFIFLPGWQFVAALVFTAIFYGMRAIGLIPNDR